MKSIDYDRIRYPNCASFAYHFMRNEYNFTMPYDEKDCGMDKKQELNALTDGRENIDINEVQSGDVITMGKVSTNLPYPTHMGVFHNGTVWHHLDNHIFRTKLDALKRMGFKVYGVYRP